MAPATEDVKAPGDASNGLAKTLALRELALLRTRTEEARKLLAELEDKVAETQKRLRTPTAVQLVQTTQQLIASMLGALTPGSKPPGEVAAQADDLQQAEPGASDPLAGPPVHFVERRRALSPSADETQRLIEQETRHGYLREANEQLILAALNAQDLQAAAEEAQSRQTEFLAVLAHELRNPLTPIRTAAALLGHVTDEEPLLRLKGIIERQSAHMTRLVDDLLDVSRVNTGKLTLRPERVQLDDVISAAVEACRAAIDARQQRFSTTLTSRPIALRGDPVRLTQIVSNLLNNASKYTHDAGNIALTASVSADRMTMTVIDDGIGISALALPTIFKPFVQEAHAVGFNGTGLGIGLTVVRELVEAHGGTVSAHSEGAGKGSRFVVVLPLHSHNL